MSNHLRNVMTTAERAAYNLALDAAIRQLESTAQDFNQMATEADAMAKEQRRNDSVRALYTRNASVHRQKADLLRGQVNFIREMKLAPESVR